jgi:hypothetical protein
LFGAAACGTGSTETSVKGSKFVSVTALSSKETAVGSKGVTPPKGVTPSGGNGTGQGAKRTGKGAKSEHSSTGKFVAHNGSIPALPEDLQFIDSVVRKQVGLVVSKETC